MSAARGLVKGITVLGFARAAQKLLLFVQFWVFVRAYGAGPDTDALIMAQTLPIFFIGVFTRGMTQTFLPVFAEWREQKGIDEAWQLATTLFLATLGLILVLVPVILVSAPAIVWALAPGLPAEYQALGGELLRWLSIVIALGGLVGVPQALYFSYRDFAVPAVAGLFQPLLTTVAILLLAGRFGVYAVVIGMIAGTFLQLLMMVALLNRGKTRLKPSFNFRGLGLRRFAKLMSGRVGIMLIARGNTIVDRIFASMIGLGGITVLAYAERLAYAPLELFNASFGTATLSVQSDDAGRGDMDSFRQRLITYARYSIFLIAPATVLLAVLARPVLTVFLREPSQAAILDLTVAALVAYSIGLLPMVLATTLRGAFFALQDTVTTLVVSVLGFGLNVGLNAVLSGPFGLTGLAAGTSIAAFIKVVLLAWLMQRRLGPLDYRQLLASTGRVLAASAIMGAAVFAIDYWLQMAQAGSLLLLLIELAAVTAAAGLVYLIACQLCGVGETARIIQKVRRFRSARRDRASVART